MPTETKRNNPLNVRSMAGALSSPDAANAIAALNRVAVQFRKAICSIVTSSLVARRDVRSGSAKMAWCVWRASPATLFINPSGCR